MDVSKQAMTIAILAVIAAAACSGGTARPTPMPTTATIVDLAYAHQSSAERLDLYLPAGSGRAPLVMWIHGGAFSVGDKSSITADESGPAPTPNGSLGPYQIQHPHVDDLLARGYAVASLDYRMEGPVKGAPDAVRDAKTAVRFLRAAAVRYRLDPDRFAVWGNSAGAYMAVMLGVTGDQRTVYDDPAIGNGSVSSVVQAVVDWYGPMALPDNPITHIATGRSLPPFLIAQGTSDQSVNPADAQDLQAALVRVGARSTLTMIPGAGHEDHAFSATQLPATYAFLDRAFGRSTG